MKVKSPELLFRALIVSLMLLILVFSVLPYLALILGSLLPNSMTDRGIGVDTLLAHRWTLDNYHDLADPTYRIFFQQLWNTFIVSSVTSLMVVFLAVPGGYALTRYRFRARTLIKQSAIWGYLFPPIILVFPYARLLYLVGLNNTRMGLVLANVAFCFPFGLWLMVQYLHAVPRDVDKAAAADGANWAQALWHVIIPRAMPGIAAVAVFCIILSWNDVALSLVLVQDKNARTIAAGVQESILRTEQTSYGTFAAASLGIAAVAVIVFGLIQFRIDRALKEEAEQA
jgi:multiple sugar transport system permease protein